MAFDPYAPYGPLVESTMRIVTWNVWGRYGEWEARQSRLEATLQRAEPDIVCLVEAWAAAAEHQPERVASVLGMEHSVFNGGVDIDDWSSGVGLASRWPIAREEWRVLPGGGDSFGGALSVVIDGPRGPIQLFVAMLDYPLDGSGKRQAQVRQLCEFVAETARRRHVTVVCGDFNAGPDSDEIRLLTGRSEPPVPGLVFYDAWEVAGDGTAGITWSNCNPLAALGRYPDRRFDYVFSAWPRAGAAGHPTRCVLLGVAAPDDPVDISDHYGVLADLRY